MSIMSIYFIQLLSQKHLKQSLTNVTTFSKSHLREFRIGPGWGNLLAWGCRSWSLDRDPPDSRCQCWRCDPSYYSLLSVFVSEKKRIERVFSDILTLTQKVSYNMLLSSYWCFALRVPYLVTSSAVTWVLLITDSKMVEKI